MFGRVEVEGGAVILPEYEREDLVNSPRVAVRYAERSRLDATMGPDVTRVMIEALQGAFTIIPLIIAIPVPTAKRDADLAGGPETL